MNTWYLHRCTSLLVVAVLALGACASSGGGSTPSDTGYEPLMAPADFPRMDGSTANIPLGKLVLQRTTGLDAATADNSVQFSTTPYAYENLADGNADLLLAYEPDTETRAKVDPGGKVLEFSPIGRDALVFVTNESNPVKDLTSDQVRDIYTGKITSWSQVGGPDAPIVAFQRPEKSGSQALMRKLVMQGTDMTAPPEELVAAEMGDLVDGVAAYDNTGTALGYSVYYYVTNQYAVDGIRLMTIDGVAPTNTTIADGTYPWVNDFYVVIRADEPATSPARQVFDWMNTDAGRQTVTDAGYVALPAP
ncbi:MAG: substrate-binding domain-containing protein [Micrococcales bacterium]|nr:substrate-binding domain-containing protein [Micrococcales bacterium]MCL2667157.1 substrate-binding domain-containing protein [Micrococcales bacterium]